MNATNETLLSGVNTKMTSKQRRKCILTFTSLCSMLTISLLLLLYVLRAVPDFTRYQLLRSYPATNIRLPNFSRPRTILFWTKFFGNPTWSLPEDTLGPAYLRDELHCAVYHCELTNRRDFLPSVDMFDAVIFHTAEAFSLINPIPQQRSVEQSYVFAQMEPPSETKHVLNDEYGFYNLTMTYRLDSDILWAFMRIEDIETGQLVAPAKYVAWRQPPDTWHDNSIARLWQGKTKMAAWYVSHCRTYSMRENLVKQLQQHIAIDIYGKCGELSVPTLKEDSDALLDQQYKFYLSFENSLCNDYVTEKIFNALQRNVLPIVFGGANYTKFLPPHSYINVEHFPNVQQLAAYLHHLSRDPKEYMRYFWWRQYYRLKATSPYCQLCEQLHSPSHEQKTQTYLNIEQWWMASQCRTESKIRF